MNYSRAFNIFLVAALVLTLPLKFIFHDRATHHGEDLANPISAFLGSHGYASQVEQRPAGLFIFATSSDCRMLIREIAAQGWNRDSIDVVGEEVGRVAFVFNGSVYADAPVGTPLIRYFWSRFLQRMGVNSARHPVLAVAASDRCSLNALPWHEIAAVSRSKSPQPKEISAIF